MRWQKKTEGMGAACAWKHRFFCPFLGSSFGHAKEEHKIKNPYELNLQFNSVHFIFQNTTKIGGYEGGPCEDATP